MIFYRHIIQELIIPFIYSFCTIMFLFFMQLAVKVLDKVLNKGIEPLIIIKIFLLNSAWMVVLAVPMSVLVATLIGFGKMSSNNEIMILKASGVNLFRVLIPVISSAGILTTSLVFFHNLVLPDANHKAASLMSDITRKKPAAVIKPGILIRDFQGYAMMVRDIDHSTGKMSGVKVFSSNGKQDNSITVAEYGYINVTPDEKYLKVKLYNGETHSLTSDKDSADYIVADFSAQSIFIENIDSRFKRTDRGYRGDREKSAQDLLRDVSEYRSEKEDAERKRDKKIEEITGFIDRLDSLCSVSGTRSAPEPDPSLYLLKNTKEEANTKEERLKQNLSFIRRIASIDPVAGTLSTSDPDSVKSMETLLSLLKNNKEKAKTRIAKLKHSIRNLNRTIKNNKKRIWKYMVEVHKKYSVSFACIIFVLIGAPLGMMVRQGSMGVGVSYSVFFFILFWSTLIGGEALSDNLIIHPAITMWSCNLILLAGGLYLCSKLIRERRIISFGPLFRWAASLKARLTPSNPEKAKPVKRISPIHGIFRRILSLLTGTLPAYFLKHFFKFFFMVMLSLCLISVVIDYISNMKNFDEGTTVEIIEYYAYFIIWMSTILLPICLLLAAMFTSGKLSENSELTAMKASGLNFYRLTLPLVFAGFVFTGVDFYINEKVFPVIVPRKQELYDKLRHGKKAIQRRKHEVKQQNDFY
ncbi:MAG: LptF/LptG family permease, partial [Chitinivibrionales bacterium]